MEKIMTFEASQDFDQQPEAGMLELEQAQLAIVGGGFVETTPA